MNIKNILEQTLQERIPHSPQKKRLTVNVSLFFAIFVF